MHKFKRNCVAQQRARIRQYYQRKNQAEKQKESLWPKAKYK